MLSGLIEVIKSDNKELIDGYLECVSNDDFKHDVSEYVALKIKEAQAASYNSVSPKCPHCGKKIIVAVTSGE